MKFWDYVSVTPVVWIMAPLFLALNTGDLWYALLTPGAVGVDLLTKGIKAVVPRSQSWAMRPAGASNCDILSRNGPCSGKPGMPSGHMATTAFFFAAMFLDALMQDSETGAWRAGWQVWVWAGVGAAMIVLVGLARVIKGCHTLLQVVLGTILGLMCAGFMVAARKIVPRKNKNGNRDAY